MDDLVVYLAFLVNTLQAQPPRVVLELVSFADTFRTLLSASDEELDNFVKSTYQSNSARANNAQILIPTPVVESLKALLFELKDRQLCDALPDLVTLLTHTTPSSPLAYSTRN